uniref:Uncharacterized protein n=1 Tax=Ditylenchus dipsaci TaxID=166011 RepID=A0A915DG95_9BILA
MDADMESVEIVFAQRLASGEPVIRKRALKLLQDFIVTESKNKTFTDESLARLCKGIHYTMWMQDKPLLQEELADSISNLINLFKSEDQVLDFVRALLIALSKEWPLIDRWRMDKFLMLIRRLFRNMLVRLKDVYSWDGVIVKDYIDFLRITTISSSSTISDSLKFHCASIYLDELDNCGGLDEQMVMVFLTPYVDILQDDVSDSLFRSVCTEIFDTILHDFSDRLAESEEDGESAGKEGVEEGLKFDYGRIAEVLLKAGSQMHVVSRRRKRIYGLSKKFEIAARGCDPYAVTETNKSGGYKPRKKKSIKG